MPKELKGNSGMWGQSHAFLQSHVISTIPFASLSFCFASCKLKEMVLTLFWETL